MIYYNLKKAVALFLAVFFMENISIAMMEPVESLPRIVLIGDDEDNPVKHLFYEYLVKSLIKQNKTVVMATDSFPFVLDESIAVLKENKQSYLEFLAVKQALKDLLPDPMSNKLLVIKEIKAILYNPVRLMTIINRIKNLHENHHIFKSKNGLKMAAEVEEYWQKFVEFALSDLSALVEAYSPLIEAPFKLSLYNYVKDKSLPFICLETDEKTAEIYDNKIQYLSHEDSAILFKSFEGKRTDRMVKVISDLYDAYRDQSAVIVIRVDNIRLSRVAAKLLRAKIPLSQLDVGSLHDKNIVRYKSEVEIKLNHNLSIDDGIRRYLSEIQIKHFDVNSSFVNDEVGIAKVCGLTDFLSNILDKKVCHNSTCKNLETLGEDLKLCSRCRLVRYCSKECQKLDWRVHKLSCKK